MKVIKTIILDEANDINILSDNLIDIDPLINSQTIRENLKSDIQKNNNIQLYQSYNLLRDADDHYKSNSDIINDLDDPNYYLTPCDFKIISKLLKIGICYYTNRFSDKDTKFQLFILIHKDLIQEELNKLLLSMICFYQDFSDNEINNKEIKLIEINNEKIINFSELYKNHEFRKRVNLIKF